jgi:short chain dehydrogenase
LIFVRYSSVGSVARFGRLDVAGNNAGTDGEFSPVAELAASKYAGTFDTNVLGTLLSMKHELRIMQEQGSGSIINVSSIYGEKGFPSASLYVASKHAIIGITRSPRWRLPRETRGDRSGDRLHQLTRRRLPHRPDDFPRRRHDRRLVTAPDNYQLGITIGPRSGAVPSSYPVPAGRADRGIACQAADWPPSADSVIAVLKVASASR